MLSSARLSVCLSVMLLQSDRIKEFCCHAVASRVNEFSRRMPCRKLFALGFRQHICHTYLEIKYDWFYKQKLSIKSSNATLQHQLQENGLGIEYMRPRITTQGHWKSSVLTFGTNKPTCNFIYTRCKIWLQLLLITNNRNVYTRFWLVPKSITFNWMTLNG